MVLPPQLLAEIQALSAPIYFGLALIVPIIIAYVITKAAIINKVLKDRVYKHRLYGTVLTFVGAMVYIELHAIGSFLGMPYIPYGIDNVIGIIALIGIYILTDSLVAIAMLYDFTPQRTLLLKARVCMRYAFVFSITTLAIATLFLEEIELYNALLVLFGAGLLVFAVSVFTLIMAVKERLDDASQRYIRWLSYLFATILVPALIDVAVDILDLPVFVNVLIIPAAFVILYAVYKGMQVLLKAKRMGREHRWTANMLTEP